MLHQRIVALYAQTACGIAVGALCVFVGIDAAVRKRAAENGGPAGENVVRCRPCRGGCAVGDVAVRHRSRVECDVAAALEVRIGIDIAVGNRDAGNDGIAVGNDKSGMEPRRTARVNRRVAGVAACASDLEDIGDHYHVCNGIVAGFEHNHAPVRTETGKRRLECGVVSRTVRLEGHRGAVGNFPLPHQLGDRGGLDGDVCRGRIPSIQQLAVLVVLPSGTAEVDSVQRRGRWCGTRDDVAGCMGSNAVRGLGSAGCDRRAGNHQVFPLLAADHLELHIAATVVILGAERQLYGGNRGGHRFAAGVGEKGV